MPERATRFFTPEEASALLPRVKPLLADVREAASAYRFHAEQVSDLQSMWGEAVEREDNRDHEEYERHARAARDARERAEAGLLALLDLGVELKDPFTGLVDFYAHRGSDVVYLCWREGEERVAHWHSLTEGFAGRKPL